MAYLLETSEATKQCADCGLLLPLTDFTPYLRPCWKASNRSKHAAVLPEAERLFHATKEMVLEGKA